SWPRECRGSSAWADPACTDPIGADPACTDPACLVDRPVNSRPGYPAMGRDREGLRVAFLAYRGNPHSGGQGVYTRHLTRALTALGHQVTVFAGQPYPLLDPGVGFVPVPSLDLYREPDPFRIPWPR